MDPVTVKLCEAARNLDESVLWLDVAMNEASAAMDALAAVLRQNEDLLSDFHQ